MFIDPIPATLLGKDSVLLLGYIADPDRMLYVGTDGKLETAPLDWFTVDIAEDQVDEDE